MKNIFFLFKNALFALSIALSIGTPNLKAMSPDAHLPLGAFHKPKHASAPHIPQATQIILPAPSYAAIIEEPLKKTRQLIFELIRDDMYKVDIARATPPLTHTDDKIGTLLDLPTKRTKAAYGKEGFYRITFEQKENGEGLIQALFSLSAKENALLKEEFISAARQITPLVKIKYDSWQQLSPTIHGHLSNAYEDGPDGPRSIIVDAFRYKITLSPEECAEQLKLRELLKHDGRIGAITPLL